MSNDNYPAGVTDAHPHFNPPQRSANTVECGSDQALVIPSFAVKAALYQMQEDAEAGNKAAVERKIAELLAVMPDWEQEREYECSFNDEVDLEESECARWDCPVCGNERETDTLPEERDPDEEWERRNER